MADSRDVRFNFTASDKGASRTMTAIASSADDLDKKLGGIHKQAKTVLGTMAGFAAVDFFKGTIDQARESQKVMAQTNAVIKSTGAAAGVSADQVSDLSTAISKKTGVDDEAIQSGENLLLTFTNIKNEAGAGNDVFNQSTQVLTDMAAAMGTDVSSQAVLLGKALNDPIKGLSALTRVGVAFTEEQKDQIKALAASGDMMGAQKIILGELTKEFGGSAAAQATTADKAAVAWGNLQEEIGGKLLPVVGSALEMFTGLLDALGPMAPTLLIGTAGLTGLAVGFRLVKSASSDVKGMITTTVDVVKRLTGASQGATVALNAEAAAGRGAGRGVAEGAIAAEGGIRGVKAALISTGVGALLVGIGEALSVAFGSSHVGEIQGLTDAIKEDGNALGTHAQAAAADTLAQAGLFDLAKKLHINLGDLTLAWMGNEDAMNRVKGSVSQLSPGMQSLGNMLINTVSHGAQDSADKLQAVRDASNALADSQRYLGKEFNAAGVPLSALDTALGMADDSHTQLQSTMAGTVVAFEREGKKARITADDINHLRSALDAINGVQKSAADAAADFEQALDDLDASTKKNGHTLDVHTQAGRDNRKAIEDVVQAVKDKAAADLAAGVPAKKIKADIDSQYKSLETLAEKWTGSKKKADEYLSSTGFIKPKIKQEIDVAVRVAVQRVATLAGGRQLDPDTGRGVQTVQRHAVGGWINGPGSGSSDSILSWLSNGEFVVNARDAGPNKKLLEMINSGKGTYAAGAMGELGKSLAPQPTDTKTLTKMLGVDVDHVRALGHTYDAVSAAYDKASAKVDSLAEKLKKLKQAHEDDLRETKLKGKALRDLRDRYADAENDLEGLITKAKTAAETADKARDKAKSAADEAKQAMLDTGRALADVVKQQANAFTDEVQSFHDSMKQAVGGGKLDLAQMMIDPNGNVGGLNWLQYNLDTYEAAAEAFGNDLQALAAAGADKDLIAQIAGLGQGQGDDLAKQLLAGGSDAIGALEGTLHKIDDVAGKAADGLTKTYYTSGMTQMQQFIKGMEDQFPSMYQFFEDLARATSAGMSAAGLNAGPDASQSGSMSRNNTGGGLGSITVVLDKKKVGAIMAPTFRQNAQLTANRTGTFVSTR